MRLVNCIAAIFYILSFSVFANEDILTDPNKVLHSVSDNTFSRLATEAERLKAEPQYINVIINEELVPYLDYKYAAYVVMGKHLKKTSKQQRGEFVEAFKTYLINGYGPLLLKYDKQKITILDNKHFNGKKIVTIPVRMRDENDQVTNFEFKFRRNSKTGHWKVFDVITEGVSVLDTKGSDITELIDKKGITEVTQLLLEKNREFTL